MKYLFLAFVVCLFFCLTVFSQNAALSIVPQPKSLKMLNGEFKLNYKTKIVATDETGRRAAGILNDLLLKYYGFKLEYTEKAQKKNAIVFAPPSAPVDPAKAEAYGLNVSPKIVLITGGETGLFYALQTLMQLLPVDFKGETKLPAVDIADEPRFGYRGMHLDVTRHFMPVEFVKRYLDLMAQYKFNQFHWHLTDDQGWRVEIKKYPRLTEIGSKRKETMKEKNFNPYIGDGIPVEGFYTQEQIKDVVAYAKARHINVIPEIEMPGHSSAALAAYPELGCRENYEYKVQTTWGIFKEVYCPTEKTFQFLEDVVSEVVGLFPDSPYIHVGGDEVLKDFWKDSPVVQELKTKENLKDEHEVQSFFVRRMEKFINSKGKKMIGWDEILEGGLAPNAVVMSWRGEKGGIEAAKARHEVIMTPTTYLYFDFNQGDTRTEPINIGNYLPLEKVYSYDPQPKELSDDEKKYILGAQANIWTEYIKTPDKVEYMAFPRMLALAEVVWSPLEAKNYADFERRLPAQFARLDKQNVNYRIPPPDGLQNQLVGGDGKTKIELRPLVNNAKIFYTTDGSTPDENSKRYDKPLEFELKPNEKAELKTLVMNEKGRKSVVYSATLLRRELLPNVELTDPKPGVNILFFKGDFKSVKELDTAASPEAFESKTLFLQQFNDRTDKLKQPFGAIFDGYLNVPADGIYEFEMETDDGGVFLVGEEAVVDLDGVHDKTTAVGLVPLKKGFHKVRLKYFQAGNDAAFNIRWGVKGQNLRRLNGTDLVHLTEK
ncbi:MAG: family 20 glycosylhydrolase [Acidobacteria bacterium]|nr:family 20 glycosylhydrolase [Acidobacteriota bacterium]